MRSKVFPIGVARVRNKDERAEKARKEGFLIRVSIQVRASGTPCRKLTRETKPSLVGVSSTKAFPPRKSFESLPLTRNEKREREKKKERYIRERRMKKLGMFDGKCYEMVVKDVMKYIVRM